MSTSNAASLATQMLQKSNKQFDTRCDAFFKAHTEKTVGWGHTKHVFQMQDILKGLGPTENKRFVQWLHANGFRTLVNDQTITVSWGDTTSPPLRKILFRA